MTFKLHEAVRDGDIEAVKDAIRLSGNLEARDELGFTPIFSALSTTSSMDCLHALINARADVNACSQEGYTPLHVLAISDEAEHAEQCMKVLLDAGADPEARLQESTTAQAEDWTPIMLAAHEGKASLVRCLINGGAQVNLEDKNGMTPLMLAANQLVDSEEKIRLLLQAGADKRKRSKTGKTALDYGKEFRDCLISGQSDNDVQGMLKELEAAIAQDLHEHGLALPYSIIENTNRGVQDSIINWPRLLSLLE